MKAFLGLAIFALVGVSFGAPASLPAKGKHQKRNQNGLRKARATSRKLGEFAQATSTETRSIGERGADVSGLFNNIPFIGSGLGAPVEALNGLLVVPRDMISSIINTAANVQGGLTGLIPLNILGQGFGAGSMPDIVGQMVDRAKDITDNSISTMENFAAGVADRGRSAFDKAAGKTASLLDQTVTAGTNSITAAQDSARNLRDEGRRVASQAATLAGDTARLGHHAFGDTLGRIAQTGAEQGEAILKNFPAPLKSIMSADQA